MKGAIHYISIVLLVAFAVGTVVQTVTATEMALDMALSDTLNSGSAGCSGCTDGGDEPPDCDLVCVSPFVTVLAIDGASAPLGAQRTAISVFQRMTDRNPPPGFKPPEIIILT